MENFDYIHLPEALTSYKQYGLCYEIKVIMAEASFLFEGINAQVRLISELLDGMERSNEKMQYIFPFYQLKVRPTRIDEYPQGVCFELRWGNREDLTKQKKRMNWISVINIEPPKGEPFLAILKNNTIVLAQYSRHYDAPTTDTPRKYEFWCYVENPRLDEVFEIRVEQHPFTHWMPLPNAPKER